MKDGVVDDLTLILRKLNRSRRWAPGCNGGDERAELGVR